jgi:hypothetical protein
MINTNGQGQGQGGDAAASTSASTPTTNVPVPNSPFGISTLTIVEMLLVIDVFAHSLVAHAYTGSVESAVAAAIARAAFVRVLELQLQSTSSGSQTGYAHILLAAAPAQT